MQAGGRNHVAGAFKYTFGGSGLRRRILCRIIYTAGDLISGRNHTDRTLALVR